MRLYVLQDDRTVLISRRRLRAPGGRPVPHSWTALTEITTTGQPRRSFIDTAFTVAPPLVTGAITAAFAPVEATVAAGGAVLLAMPYLEPRVRRRWTNRRRRADALVLTGADERVAFARAVALADRVGATWPALGSLVDAAEAGQLLAEALWEIAGRLVRRQELRALLSELSSAGTPAGETGRELFTQVYVVRSALADLDIDLARREASLSRVEMAGRDFIRDQRARQAIRSAEAALRSHPPAPGRADAAADLAEQTDTVLTAYRELTNAHPPGRSQAAP